MTYAIYEDSGLAQTDAITDGILTSLTAGAGELWYVEELWIKKSGDDSSSAGADYYARHRTSNNDVRRSAKAGSADGNGVYAISGFYLYANETAEIEEVGDGDDNTEEHRWRIVARRVL